MLERLLLMLSGISVTTPPPASGWEFMQTDDVLSSMSGVFFVPVSERKPTPGVNSMLVAEATWHDLLLKTGFLQVTLVNSSSSIRSGCTHMIAPSGAGIGTNHCSRCCCGSMLTIWSSTFKIRFTNVGIGGNCPNCTKEVVLAETTFCSGCSLSALVPTRAWRISLSW